MQNLELTEDDNKRLFKSILNKFQNIQKTEYSMVEEIFEAEDEVQAYYGKYPNFFIDSKTPNFDTIKKAALKKLAFSSSETWSESYIDSMKNLLIAVENKDIESVLKFDFEILN